MDFYGFSFNGYHSSEMGFIRTSDGNRYNDTVGPNFQDKTIQIPGGDGTYFFNSFNTQKPFSINIAFDSMTEEQLRTVRQVFNSKDIGPLIFDENPYKAYVVKLQSPIQLKYLCFDEPARTSSTWIHNTTLNPSTATNPVATAQATHRVYKGEGTIQFIAYQPYAYSVHKYLNEFYDCDNIDEWKDASHMLAAPTNLYPEGIIYNRGDEPYSVNLYNAGDIPTDFQVFFDASDLATESAQPLSINLVEDGQITHSLNLDFTKISGERATMSGIDYISINTKTNLVEGYANLDTPAGVLYNDAIVSGDFFKIPVTTTKSNVLLTTLSSTSNITLSSAEHGITLILYNYLYY